MGSPRRHLERPIEGRGGCSAGSAPSLGVRAGDRDAVNCAAVQRYQCPLSGATI